MRALLLWFIAYFLPFAVAYAGVHYLYHRTHWRHRIIAGVGIIHIALIVSILLCQYLIQQNNTSFPFAYSWISVALLAIAVTSSAWLLQGAGLAYSASAAIQQLCMLSAVALLLPYLPIGAILLLVVPVYIIGHFLNPRQWKIKTLVTLVWGTAAVLIYIAFSDVLLITAIHIIGGSILLKKGIIYSS
jgi:hypothetical protein